MIHLRIPDCFLNHCLRIRLPMNVLHKVKNFLNMDMHFHNLQHILYYFYMDKLYRKLTALLHLYNYLTIPYRINLRLLQIQ